VRTKFDDVHSSQYRVLKAVVVVVTLNVHYSLLRRCKFRRIGMNVGYLPSVVDSGPSRVVGSYIFQVWWTIAQSVVAKFLQDLVS